MNYAYDALQRLTTATENGTFVLASYTYDPLSRRTGEARGNGTSATLTYSTGIDLLSLVNTFVGSSVTPTNTYTPTHQFLSQTASNTTWNFQPAVFETTNYAAANNLNQYTQVTQGANPTVTLAFDGSGNLTGDGTLVLAYDAENKLRSANKSGTTATYAYDPLLRREGKIVNGVTTTFLLDGAEEIGDYDSTGAMLRRYVPSNETDTPIAVIEGTGGGTTRTWFHRNPLGSTIAMSNAAGTVSEGPITYDAFGKSTSTGGIALKYTGRRFDAETGLYYYRTRYYSPALGRFVQTDPIGTCDNMNLYAYVDNDPLNMTDPSGLAPDAIVWGQRPIRGSMTDFRGSYVSRGIVNGINNGVSEAGPGAPTRGGCTGDATQGGLTCTATATRLRRQTFVAGFASIPTEKNWWEERYGKMAPGETCYDHCVTAVAKNFLRYLGWAAGISSLKTLGDALLFGGKDLELLLDVQGLYKGTAARKLAARRFIYALILGGGAAALSDFYLCQMACPGG